MSSPCPKTEDVARRTCVPLDGMASLGRKKPDRTLCAGKSDGDLGYAEVQDDGSWLCGYCRDGYVSAHYLCKGDQ